MQIQLKIEMDRIARNIHEATTRLSMKEFLNLK